MAGFTEAEGSFSYRKKQEIVGFSIAQRYDRHIMAAIRDELKITASSVREQSKDL